MCIAAPILVSDRASIPSTAGRTGILEEAMISPTLFRLVAMFEQLPSFRGLWSRFVRWFFWGDHARSFSSASE
jgi:hypothetical protein